MSDRQNQAEARIDSWWRLPTAAEADEAARASLELMPATPGLIQFAVLRSPEEPALFLQSRWTTAAARDHYVHHVAPAPKAAVDALAPRIERDRALTEVVESVSHAEGTARRWTVRRLPVAGVDLAAVVDRQRERLRAEQPPGRLRASIGVALAPAEVVVIEEWSDPDVPGYAPVGVVRAETR